MQPIEKCLKLLFWPVPIADGDYNMLCEQAERHRIKLRVDLPRSVRGPVERLAFFRLASIFLGVTVLMHRILPVSSLWRLCQACSPFLRL